jgi:hypothetical protein
LVALNAHLASALFFDEDGNSVGVAAEFALREKVSPDELCQFIVFCAIGRDDHGALWAVDEFAGDGGKAGVLVVVLVNLNRLRCLGSLCDANQPRLNRNMVYLGACLIAGMRLACHKQVNVRVIPTIQAIEESVDLAHEVYDRVFRLVPRTSP